jgi:hypothetical protein
MDPSEVNEPFARIDVQTIYNLLLAVRDTTNRLEGKVDTFHSNLERIDARITEHATFIGAIDTRLTQLESSGAGVQHELRIRSLEAWKYALPATAVLALGGLVTALFKLFA